MSVASHDLFNTKLRTCLDTGNFPVLVLKVFNEKESILFK